MTHKKEIVTIEEMPDCWRDTHREARNWGQYPLNGAERREVTREEAEEIIAADEDGYAHIVEGDETDEDGSPVKYGYTFEEWLHAAGRRDSASEYDLRAAWDAGEDPSVYAE